MEKPQRMELRSVWPLRRNPIEPSTLWPTRMVSTRMTMGTA